MTTNCENSQLRNAQLSDKAVSFCACASSYISCAWTSAGAFAYFSVYSCYFKTLTFYPSRWTFGTLSARKIRIGAGAQRHCFSRKLPIAQLPILTISRHVIAVSAQQLDNEKGVRCIRRRNGSTAGQFSQFFCRFLPRRL